MSFVEPTKASDVSDAESFCHHVHDLIGTPIAARAVARTKKKSKLFFEQYPNADWGTLCRVARWAKDRRKRPAQADYLVDWVRFAWADGRLPELDADPRDPAVDAAIQEAVAAEPQREWRYRLMRAIGPEAQREVLDLWKRQRSFVSQ